MNTKNSNAPFQDFSCCDYDKHWSWSNFNRHIITCNALKDLPHEATVVEFGAADSPVFDMLQRNFGRDDIEYIRTDITKDNGCQYVNLDSIEYPIELSMMLKSKVDAIVICEVIEHLDSTLDKVFNLCYNILKENGVIVCSTPTPPCFCKYETRVWPDDHEKEYSEHEVEEAMNPYFKIQQRIGWSLEEREYNSLLAQDKLAGEVYLKLRGKMPESYIRALIPMLIEQHWCRQMTFVGKKRRAKNQYPTTKTGW